MTYRFQLLRYVPNRLSEEFYNVGVLLYDDAGKLLDARFAPDLQRLRCNPLVDLPFLRMLQDEFEERRLAGAGFSQYVGELKQHLSQGLQISECCGFLGGETIDEIERLVRTYLATIRPAAGHRVEAAPGARRWILDRMRDSFRLHGLADHLATHEAVGALVSPRFQFQIDYVYKPNGYLHYLQALSIHRDMTDVARLCFVFDRIRAQRSVALTAVVADALPDDSRELLASSEIRPWSVSRIDDLAMEVRRDLRLG